MRLCITATGRDLASATDSSFGRAAWFVIVDTESGSVEAIENSSVNVRQGAGIAAAQVLADKNVQAVLTGRLGPKAQAALSAAKIQMYEGLEQTTVGQALEQFRKGRYSGSEDSSRKSTAGTGCGRGAGGGGRGLGPGRRQGRGGRS